MTYRLHIVQNHKKLPCLKCHVLTSFLNGLSSTNYRNTPQNYFFISIKFMDNKVVMHLLTMEFKHLDLVNLEKCFDKHLVIVQKRKHLILKDMKLSKNNT